VKPPLILLLVLIPAFGMTCRTGIEGLRTSRAVFFGQYQDWGPFDRRSQPKRYWAAVAWAFGLSALAASSIAYVATENL
jgi:hypothetical protein